MNISTCEYVEIGDVEVEVKIEGTYVPGYRGSSYEPPHDADFEDVVAYVVVPGTQPGETARLELTEELIEKFELAPVESLFAAYAREVEHGE